MPRAALAVLTILLCALPATAQPLADRVPADAIAYVGWRGSANLGPGYEGSHTKAVVEASGFPQLFNAFLPDLIRKVRAKEPAAADAMDMAAAVGAPLWRHPSAFYFGGIDLTDPKQPRPRLALLCDAGDDAAQLLGRLNAAIAKATDVPFPITAAAHGGVVVVSTFDLPAKPEASLSARPEFTAAQSQVQPDALATAYVDGDALLQTIDLLVNARGDANAVKTWPKVREALGISGLKRVICSIGFDGADLGTRAFIEAPAPRKGALALLDGKPLPDDLLKSVPKDATLVVAGGFDLSRLLAEARAAAKAIDPAAAQQLEKGISAASLMLGANVERDLIDPLGPHWAAYCSPSVGGTGILGLTVVNRLDDAAKAERTLGLLEMLANNMIGMQTRKKPDGPRIAFRTTKAADMTVHFLPVPLVSPAWGVRGQNLYVSFFPQVLTTAATHAVTAKDSILDNESFVAARSRVTGAGGGKDATAIRFVDLAAVGPEGYASVLAVAQIGLGFADLFGVPAPPMVVPPLDKLRPHFTPIAAAARSDDRGLYYHKVVPFPAAEYFEPHNQISMGNNAMLISILLPSLNRARETANRVKCAANLHQLARALLMHANANGGKYPASLGEVYRTQDITMENCVCPSSKLGLPQHVRDAGMDAKVRWVDENASYVYLGAGKLSTMPADAVLAYEHLRNHGGDGMNVLYGDGSVVFLQRAEAEKVLAAQKSSAEPSR